MNFKEVLEQKVKAAEQIVCSYLPEEEGYQRTVIDAINQYDNSVIVGVTLFYTVLSVLSLILGDVVMATVDPRISFTEKAR